MRTELDSGWLDALEALDYAFQPISAFADGSVYGFEALLRGWDEAGFQGIQDVFDRAFSEGILCPLELALRRKAFSKFAMAGLGSAKLFYNLDNRLIGLSEYSGGHTIRIAQEVGLAVSRIVLEVSELHEPQEEAPFERVISWYRDQGLRIALDDFGSGYAGLKLLHRAEPDIVKIDRYFVEGVGDDPRKAAFLEKVAGLSHLMGISVIAEGVETVSELRACAEAGCDLVQGFYVARPTRAMGELSLHYESSIATVEGERRAGPSGTIRREDILRVPPLRLGDDIAAVLERFRKDPSASFIPVVDEGNGPVGAYRERDFRPYVYSPFGISLLSHTRAEKGAAGLLVKAPTAPLPSELSKILELYGASSASGGVILTEGGAYRGVIPAESILALVAERELAEARDQNPLTRLPGNLRIDEACAQRLADPGQGAAFAYLDFDSFKPFNDLYGFRNGDRVIMLFADILQASVKRPSGFIGHLGGDDFFAIMENADVNACIALLESMSERFEHEVASFYAPADRDRGWIRGRDRSGREKRMPLMTVSAALVYLKPGARIDAEELSERLASLKRTAKASPGHLAVAIVEPRQIGDGHCGHEGLGPAPDARDERPASAKPLLRGLPVFRPSLIVST